MSTYPDEVDPAPDVPRNCQEAVNRVNARLGPKAGEAGKRKVNAEASLAQTSLLIVPPVFYPAPDVPGGCETATSESTSCRVTRVV